MSKLTRSGYSSNIPSCCHLQSSVRKRPSPVSVIRPITFFIIYRIFFCMRFSRYVLFVRLTKLSYASLRFANRLALNSYSLCSYSFSCFRRNGDGEIRTLDPLLARQVLSQLSYTPTGIWQPPTLPHRLQCSTIGRLGLNHRVRDGNGCVP